MATGDLTINGQDAYTAWGLSLDPNGLSALMTPPPQKDLIANSSRLEHGKRVITTNPRMADRDITLTINLTAYSESQFISRYAAFCQVLAGGVLNIQTKYQPGVVYHCNYVSCNQFAEYQRGIAKFVLRLNEPNPSYREG